jgi:hypothetical protein
MRPDYRELLPVLVKALHTTVTDYYYFPEVVFAGRHRIDREAFDLMLAHGFLKEVKHDAFGRFYILTPQAHQLIHEQITGRHTYKRKKGAPRAVQASFCFC